MKTTQLELLIVNYEQVIICNLLTQLTIKEEDMNYILIKIPKLS